MTDEHEYETFLTMTTEQYQRLAANAKARGRNKYNARGQVIDGYRFDSGAEARRYLYLKSEAQAGRITEFKPRPPALTLVPAAYDAHGARINAITYRPDFLYTEAATGQRVIEDVKGGKATRTDAFSIRWRLLRHKFKGDPMTRCEIVEA